MSPQILKLDRVTLVAPLGLRFSDFASGTMVGDGLDVQVYPPGSPSKKVPAIANRKGVYVLHHAPGLRELEHGKGDDAFWKDMPPPRDFVVEVNDKERRFQPFHFIAGLPAKGFYGWMDPLVSSPPSTATSIPLYSSAVRAVPAGMAVVRADLWDASKDVAASWAVIEAALNARTIARGIADEQGRIALIFPYPAPRSFSISSPPGSPLGSPPTANTLALTEQIWSLRLRAFYSTDRPIASPLNASAARSALPDLRFTLSQPEATIWADATCTEPLLEASLQYGRELILQSTASTSPPSQLRQSVLFITPAGSPP